MQRVVGVHGSACTSGMRYTRIEDEGTVKRERERSREGKKNRKKTRMGFKTRWGSGPGKLYRPTFLFSFHGEMNGERTKSRDRSSTRNPVWEQDARESSVRERASVKSVRSSSISLSARIPGTSMCGLIKSWAP